MRKDEIFIIGFGGLAGVISSIINEDSKYEIIYVVENIKLTKTQNTISFDKFYKKSSGTNVVIGVGENIVRKSIYQKIKKYKFCYPNIISNYSYISKQHKIGFGNIIMPMSVINSYAEIENFNIINTSSIVEHDCKLSSYCTLSPNSVICGKCKLNEGAFLGASSTIIQNIEVGEWSVVGSSSTVVTNIEKQTLNVGSPSLIKKKINKKFKVFSKT